jgi:hypothetical protein
MKNRSNPNNFLLKVVGFTHDNSDENLTIVSVEEVDKVIQELS